MRLLKRILVRIRFRPEWMVIAYCYLIIFHLLPSVVILPTVTVDPSIFTNAILWFLCGVIGVSVVVGYQSRKPAGTEAGLATLLYAGTMTIVLRWDFSMGWTSSGLTEEHHKMLVYVVGIAVVLAMLGAWGGWAVRRTRERARDK